MDADNLLYALGISVSICVWFLKGTMAELKAMKNEVIEHDKEIGILKSEQNNIYKRFDKLDKNFENMSEKIDTLITRLPNNH